MTPFLEQVAKHYCQTGEDISRLLFVFPSRRAIVFFHKYLAQVITQSGRGPVIAPQCLSISDFFAGLSPLRKADRITQLLRLYDCYSDICRQRGQECETLDEFVFWGGTVLSDFGDVDKYMVNAADLFRNVSEYREIANDYSDLSPAQADAIRQFLGHFETQGEYKHRFARLWNLLGPLYDAFNASLEAEGLCYEGQQFLHIVRDIRDRGAEAVLRDGFPDCTKVVFCGLNALNECEKTILGKLRDLSLAEFCWDYVSQWIQDRSNRSSFFMRDNMSAFPQAFALEKCDSVPEFELVSVPSGVGQAKVLSQLLEDESVPKDERTAVLLPDESLLLPVLNSIPDSVRSVNVTMGYPMLSSSFYSLMDNIAQMQLQSRTREDAVQFYHRPLWNVLSNNIFSALCDEAFLDRVDEIRKERRYYVDAASLTGSPLTDTVFAAAGDTTAQLIDYQLRVLEYIGSAIAGDETLRQEFALELDFAMEYTRCVNLLASHKLQIQPQTYLRLLRSLLSFKSIPFKGEPLTGLQIMGPLEIRALDFDRLFILSCNESVFPRKSTSPSFIPAQLRAGFGLPTYVYQDAVWAYYFYRMVQRPGRVTMLLDSRAEGLKSGEESRYIKQLEYNYSVPVRRSIAASSPGSPAVSGDIAKTSEDVETLLSRPLSASAIKSYLHCPAQFYYSFVKGLKAEEEVAESMDNAMTGNVFHKVMELLYTTVDHRVTAPFIQSCLDNPAQIQEMVNRQVMEQMHSTQIKGRDLVVSRLLCKYVLKTLEWDLKSLQDNGMDAFEICGLELPLDCRFGRFRLKGIIDRLDSFRPGELRVVDYKTGKVVDKDTGITDANASETAELIFRKEVVDRPEIALQFFVYDYLLRNTGDKRVLQATCRYDKLAGSVYSTRKIMSSQPVTDAVSESFYDEMTARLGDLLEEIANIDLPFSRTPHRKKCEWCDFKNLCGR